MSQGTPGQIMNPCFQAVKAKAIIVVIKSSDDVIGLERLYFVFSCVNYTFGHPELISAVI